jgi:hypothetical protein
MNILSGAYFCTLQLPIVANMWNFQKMAQEGRDVTEVLGKCNFTDKID